MNGRIADREDAKRQKRGQDEPERRRAATGKSSTGRGEMEQIIVEEKPEPFAIAAKRLFRAPRDAARHVAQSSWLPRAVRAALKFPVGAVGGRRDAGTGTGTGTGDTFTERPARTSDRATRSYGMERSKDVRIACASRRRPRPADSNGTRSR